MRVTEAGLHSSLLARLGASRQELDRTLTQLADRKRVRQASDDPTGFGFALSLRGRLVRLEGFERAASRARFDLATLDTTLGEAFEIISTARTIALKGASDTSDANVELLANEVDDLRARLLALANIEHGGRFLFSGTETLTEPFDATFAYSGSDAEVEALIDDSERVGATLSGRAVFLDGGDVFALLSDLSAALRAHDSAATAALLPDLADRLDRFGESHAEVGLRLQRIDGAASRHSDERLRVQTRISEIEDIPIERAAFELSAAQSSYDALASSAARVLGRSLFDYLG